MKKDKKTVKGKIIKHTPYGIEILWDNGEKIFVENKDIKDIQ